MMKGRFWAAAAAGGVTLFFVGFFLWGIVFDGFFAAHVGSATGVVKEQMDFLQLSLGQFLWAVLLAVVIGIYARVAGFGPGFKIGALLGFLMSLSVGLTQLSMTNLFDLTTALTDPLVSGLWSGLGGGVIGWVLGGGREKATT